MFLNLACGPFNLFTKFLSNVCCNNLRKPSSLRHLARRRKALVYVSKVGVQLWWQKDCECQVCLHGIEIQAEHGTHDTGSYLGQVIWNPEAVGTLSICSLSLGRQKHCWLIPQKGTVSHPGDCFSSLGVASLFHFRYVGGTTRSLKRMLMSAVRDNFTFQILSDTCFHRCNIFWSVVPQTRSLRVAWQYGGILLQLLVDHMGMLNSVGFQKE